MEKTYNKIWEIALKKISVRPMSKFEISKKLEEKFPDEEELIKKVVQEMERVFLLNDKQFTEKYINHLTQKNIGRIKIMVEARKKGLSSDMAEEALININWNEENSCQKAFELKDKLIREEDPRKRKQKLTNFLLSRGFTNSVIYKVLS